MKRVLLVEVAWKPRGKTTAHHRRSTPSTHALPPWIERAGRRNYHAVAEPPFYTNSVGGSRALHAALPAQVDTQEMQAAAQTKESYCTITIVPIATDPQCTRFTFSTPVCFNSFAPVRRQPGYLTGFRSETVETSGMAAHLRRLPGDCVLKHVGVDGREMGRQNDRICRRSRKPVRYPG